VTFVGAEGEVTITATAKDASKKFGTAKIKVVKNVTGIRVPVSNIYLQKGKSLTIPVALDDSSDKKATVSAKLTWKSSKSTLKVTDKGRITASNKIKKKTTVNVTITAENGKRKTIKVIIVPKAKKLSGVTAKLPKKLTMKNGQTYNIKVKLRTETATGVNVTFKSSKKSVVSVDKAGKLIAHKKGKARITIKAGKKKYVKTIRVK
jgi:hypothetical protein